MKRTLLLSAMGAVLMMGLNVFAQNSLTATVGTPTLDGVVSPEEWTSDMITTAKGLTLKAMVDDDNLYVLASWDDATSTHSIAKNQWTFDGATWSASGDEDRVGIIWDMGQNGADAANCLTMCHGTEMKTNVGKVDVWHWKAARTNPLGFTDDKWWDTAGRHGDAGSGIDSRNADNGFGLPSFMAATDANASVDILLGDLAALNGFDPFGVTPGAADTAVAFDSTVTFNTGAAIPGRILSLPTGNRASVRSAGKYDNGTWNVEFSRPLTSDDDDFVVVPGSSVQFTTEVFDNEGSGHPGDGFDATIYTLNFPETGGSNTSLTATIGTPSLDGVASPGEWTSDAITTATGLTVKSMIDEDKLYVLATWMDATSTHSIAKNQWSFDGATWSSSGDEDRVGIIWDMGQNGADGVNCLTMCHGTEMKTNVGKVDVWHWKAARTNPLGFLDDKWWDTAGRHGDAGTGIDSRNADDGAGLPSFMAATDPNASVDILLGDLAAQNGFDPFGVTPGTADTAVVFDAAATFNTDATIPGRILSLPTGNRASVHSAGKYDSGIWTVEFSRDLVSDDDDFDAIPGSSVDFSTEIFDNEGSGHPTDGFDATIYTLNFPAVPVDKTSLTATIGTPTLDGVADSGEWTSDAITTSKGLTVQAMVDAEYLYVLSKWTDATTTHSIAKNQWSFDGTTWSSSSDEDRVGIVWDMGQNGTDGANCLTMCHGTEMKTNVGKVDVWHWKAARTNPLGFLDDKWWDTAGRHGDAGTGIDSRNSDDGSGLPSFMASTDPNASVDILLGNLAALNGFDPFGVTPGTADTAVAFDAGATFDTGATIPGRILSLPTGNRASVHSAGKYDNGVWTVEFKRLLSSDTDDFTVVSEGSVDFTTEVFDNEGSGHPGDGFDATIYTLNFPVITNVESTSGTQIPRSYALLQNYPNPFNPSTTIRFDLKQSGNVELKIYDILGRKIAEVVNKQFDAGSHKVDFDASNLSTGVYVYRLTVNGFNDVKKMVFIK